MSAASIKSGSKSKLTISQITVIGVMTAVTCILAPLSLPIGPVPISLTNLAIYFALYALGTFKGTISYLIYLLLGLAGLPVFSGFTSGPGKLFGPTGGYLIGFIPLAIISGLVLDRYLNNKVISIIGLAAGTAVCYAFGTAWLAYQANMSFQAALMAGVIPFIPGDLIKICIAAMIGPQLRKRLIQANLY